MITPLTTQILSNRAVLRLSGLNVLAFLHNILTCELLSLPSQIWAYGALLSPQGKIQHDLFVGHDGTTVFIDCAASHVDDLLQKLKLYRLRAKIDIVRAEALNVVASDGAIPAQVSAFDPRLAAMGHRSIVATATLSGVGNYEAHRIALGVADSDADIGTNQLFPHEANFDLLNGVSFSKGCYVGQEVVSRMHHRGTARSRIMPVASNELLPPPNTPIKSGETTIGLLLSTHEKFGLALVRLDRWHEASLPIEAENSALVLRSLPWILQNILEPAKS